MGNETTTPDFVDALVSEVQQDLDKEYAERAKKVIAKSLKLIKDAEIVLRNTRAEHEVLLAAIRSGRFNADAKCGERLY